MYIFYVVSKEKKHIKDIAVKNLRLLLLMLATVLLCCSSCQKAPSGPSDGEIIEPPEPQRMAYHCGKASCVGDDIYFVSSASFNKAQIFASEYGTENFETFIPCFDAVCNHRDRSKCCTAISSFNGGTKQLAAFLYNDELSLVLFNSIDICISKPYLNVKTNLVCESIVNEAYPTDAASALAYLEALKSAPNRSEPLVYGDYFYYAELKNGTRTQYRIPLTGGEPERVFEEDNIIIRTIINDRFYGIRYDDDIGEHVNIREDRDKIHYFRSDMNYENIETLPEILDFFNLPRGDDFRPISNAILDADKDFIYVLNDMKVWKISDSDINAEPILLSDMGEKIPSDLPPLTWEVSWYNDGIIYLVINTDQYNRSLLNDQGNSTSPTQWYEKSTLYCFDIETGECKELDISSQSYLITEVLYADDKYVYAEGSYVHDDNRSQQGVTMRLTLDTMRYEAILPDRFLEYSAETAAE